jgi:flagellar secretion chaperone FliS
MKAHARYKSNSLQTASKENLMVLLFQKALGNLTVCEAGDWSKNNNELYDLADRAMAIVLELRSSLNHDVAPELCDQLDNLYGFVVAEIVKGTTNNKVLHFQQARTTLEPIASAFAQAVKKA